MREAAVFVVWVEARVGVVWVWFARLELFTSGWGFGEGEGPAVEEPGFEWG